MTESRCLLFGDDFLLVRGLHGGEECVVANLDSVDVQDALRRRDESEVDHMRQRPTANQRENKKRVRNVRNGERADWPEYKATRGIQ